MKQFSLIFLAFFTQQINAQVFIEASDAPFEQVSDGSIAFADVDGDNDQDLLITGRSSASGPITKLYINDGGGNFSEVPNTPFENLYGGSIAFADIDGDNDQDVLITGDKATFSPTTKLYTNDGAGNFTEVLNVPLVRVTNGSVAFADVDGDNDQDVLITGTSSTLAQTTKLYLNDGAGNFTLASNTSFEQVDGSSIAFADVDGDNDQDLFLTGYSAGAGAISYLYTNDGAGNFGVAFVVAGVYNGAVALADVDGDNDQDVLVTGRPGLPMPLTARLYLNNGSNYLDGVPGTPFAGVEFSAVAFADVDGDNDPDLLITGSGMNGRISKLYINDGAGNFSEVSNTPFAAVLFGAVAFADVDGDNDQDLLLTGNSAGGELTRLYINQSIDTGIEEVLGISSIEFLLYPNPASGQAVNVIFNTERSGLVNAKVFDANGRLVVQLQQATGKGQQQLILNVAKLAKGSYLLQLDDGVRQGSKTFLVD